MARNHVDVKAVLMRGPREIGKFSFASDLTLKSTVSTVAKIQCAINEKLTEIINDECQNSNAKHPAIEENSDDEDDTEDSVSDNHCKLTEPSMKRLSQPPLTQENFSLIFGWNHPNYVNQEIVIEMNTIISCKRLTQSKLEQMDNTMKYRYRDVSDETCNSNHSPGNVTKSSATINMANGTSLSAEDIQESMAHLKEKLDFLKTIVESDSSNQFLQPKKTPTFIDENILSAIFAVALAAILGVAVYAFQGLYIAVSKRWFS